MDLQSSSLVLPMSLPAALAFVLIIYFWRDRRDRNKLARLRAAYRTRTEKMAMPEPQTTEPVPTTAQGDQPGPAAIDLDKVTLGDLKRLIARATELDKPGKIMSVLTSRRAYAAVGTIIANWSAYFSDAIDLPTAIQNTIITVAAWVLSDGVRETK